MPLDEITTRTPNRSRTRTSTRLWCHGCGALEKQGDQIRYREYPIWRSFARTNTRRWRKPHAEPETTRLTRSSGSTCGTRPTSGSRDAFSATPSSRKKFGPCGKACWKACWMLSHTCGTEVLLRIADRFLLTRHRGTLAHVAGPARLSRRPTVNRHSSSHCRRTESWTRQPQSWAETAASARASPGPDDGRPLLFARPGSGKLQSMVWLENRWSSLDGAPWRWRFTAFIVGCLVLLLAAIAAGLDGYAFLAILAGPLRLSGVS
jgi:hypothetical protein